MAEKFSKSHEIWELIKSPKDGIICNQRIWASRKIQLIILSFEEMSTQNVNSQSVKNRDLGIEKLIFK